METILTQYVLEIISLVLAAAFTWIGAELKKLYNKYIDTQTKKDVVNTVVQAVEQIYKDLHGNDKLNKALEMASGMFEEKGITVTETELLVLVESAVGSFNNVFNKGIAIEDKTVTGFIK